MHSALMEERLTSETYLTAEMEKLLDLNKKLSAQNDAVMGELNVEKEQIKELIQIHLDYEDELEERWSEIIGNVEEIRKLQDQLWGLTFLRSWLNFLELILLIINTYFNINIFYYLILFIGDYKFPSLKKCRSLGTAPSSRNVKHGQ